MFNPQYECKRIKQVGCGVQRALVLLLLQATTLAVVDFIVRYIIN